MSNECVPRTELLDLDIFAFLSLQKGPSFQKLAGS